MAEKLVYGDSLGNEVISKFNGMADEVNALKESGGGGSVDTSNLVTLDGKQTITGNKYFTGNIYLNGNTNLKKLFVAQSDGSNTLTQGAAGQTLKTNGSTVYWGDVNAECIEDVVELPNREYLIDTSKMYRVTTVQSLVGGVKNQMPNPSTWLPDMLSGIPINIRHVEAIPTAGIEPAYDNLDKPTRFVFYYLVTGEKLTDWSTDERIYAFLPAGTHLNTSTTYDVDTWVPVSAFLAHYMITDKGVITSEAEATSSSHSSMYFLADIELYHYRNGWQKVSKGVTEEKVSEMIEEAVADIPSGGGGSGGGGGSIPADAIIDVDELPTEENAYLFQNGAKVEEYLMRKVVVHIVDTLPEVGEPLLTGSPSATMNVYYQKGDDEAYCYFTENVKPGYNYVGWSTLASGCTVLSITYGGVVTDESQATNSNALYLVYKASSLNTKAIYRVAETTCNTFFNGFVNNLGSPVTIHTVDTLPATGEPIYDNIETPTKITGYYQKSDGNVYAWMPTAMGVPNDMWMPLESVLATQNIPYGGFVTSTTGLPNGTVYLFLEYSIKLYHYKDGWQLLGDGNNKSRVFAISVSDGAGEDTTEGSYTLMQLGGHSLTQCTELFSHLRAKQLNIASIQYTSRVRGGQGISVPAKLVTLDGYWYLDVNLEGFYQTIKTGLALRNDGVLIYTTDDWNFLALAYFQIVVTTY